MNGFFLLLPFFVVRFGLLGGLNKNAIRRAGYAAARFKRGYGTNRKEKLCADEKAVVEDAVPEGDFG